jgi:selenocysteine-specific elongation factor
LDRFKKARLGKLRSRSDAHEKDGTLLDTKATPDCRVNARTLILGTAGHIDHGKTTLLRALTGIDCDRLPEEKQRGITIDIGFAHLDLGPFQLGIVDVPGHERFIKNMLAGAVGIDIALLVIAADDSVMPQTREHLAILRLLDVRHGVVAITKCDRVEPSWLELVEDDVRNLVAGSFLEGAPVVRTSMVSDGSAQGIDDLRTAIRSVCEHVTELSQSELFRLPVDRAFSVQGLGTVVTGTVWSGRLRAGDDIEWLPAKKRVTVRGLQNHGMQTDEVVRGQRAAINLGGVHQSEILRGHELATAGYLVPSKILTVDLQVLGDSPWPIKHRSRQRLYVGTQEVMVTVALLQDSLVEPGQSALAQLHCARPVVAIGSQPFVIRAESPLITIGGGRILLPRQPRVSRRQPALVERLSALRRANEVQRAELAIYMYGLHAWKELDLCRDAAVDLKRVGQLIEKLVASGIVIKLSVKPSATLLVHHDVLKDAEQRVLTTLSQLHAQWPLRPSIARDQVTLQCQSWHDAQVTDALVDRLVECGQVRSDHNRVALAGFSPRLTPAQERLRGQMLTAWQQAALKPPEPAELCQSLSSDERELRQMLDLCTAQGELVHVKDDIFLHQQVESTMRSQLARALANGKQLTVSEIRDLLATTRKFAVPICEYLDRIGFTRRDGDLRSLR